MGFSITYGSCRADVFANFWDSYFTMLGLAESGHSISSRIWSPIFHGNQRFVMSQQLRDYSKPLATTSCPDGRVTSAGSMISDLIEAIPTTMPICYSISSKTCKPDDEAVKLQDGIFLNSSGRSRYASQSHRWRYFHRQKRSESNRPAPEFHRDLRSAAASLGFGLALDGQLHQLNTLRTTSIVPVDLNSLMFKMEKILARASKAAGDNAMKPVRNAGKCPSKRDRKIHVDVLTRLVCRLRPEVIKCAIS